MKNILLISFFTAVLTISNPLSAGTISEAAKKILTKADKAQGLDNLKSVKSMTVNIAMSMPAQNLNGTSKIIVTKEKITSKVVIGPMKMENGSNGTIVWSKDMMFGIRELKGQEALDIKTQTIDALLNPTKYYDSIELGADKVFDNKKCVTLIYKKTGAYDKNYYIDKETFLPIGLDTKTKGPSGDMPSTTYFKKYTTLKNGYKYASEVLMDMKVAKMTMKVTSLAFDEKVDDKIFEKPTK